MSFTKDKAWMRRGVRGQYEGPKRGPTVKKMATVKEHLSAKPGMFAFVQLLFLNKEVLISEKSGALIRFSWREVTNRSRAHGWQKDAGREHSEDSCIALCGYQLWCWNSDHWTVIIVGYSQFVSINHTHTKLLTFADKSTALFQKKFFSYHTPPGRSRVCLLVIYVVLNCGNGRITSNAQVPCSLSVMCKTFQQFCSLPEMDKNSVVHYW